MRVLFFSVLLVCGCGGNWSNADLAFADALPRKGDLKARLPSASAAQPLEGVATRRDGLMVGEPSNAWAVTQKAGVDFNALLDQVLGIVEQVRTAPPTTRTSASRTWGPFGDANNQGREVQVVITKSDETTFAWKIESRPANGAFILIADGNFAATDTARRGRGSFTVHVKDFRDVVEVTEDMKKLDEIVVGYVTDLDPVRTEMLFTFAPGSTSAYSSVGYTARHQKDLSGAMRFVYTLPGPELLEVELNSAWKSTGEGRGLGLVTRGTYAGFNVTECWDRRFKVVHFFESWPGGVSSGPSSDCAVIDGL